MDTHLPGIIVTGASGFVGRNFLKAVSGKFRLFCLARRSQNEAGVPQNTNLHWTQVDIAKWDRVKEVAECVKQFGGADYVLHLAGYYDFTNKNHPEYERTNVRGTHNILNLSKMTGIKRFLFASSLAACKFPPSDKVVDEQSPPDANYPYALSKRLGEEMIYDYSKHFTCTIIRMAAVFSDWCEYPPLYVFLNTWLSRKWNSRILGGRGLTAIPYIHINDLINFVLKVIELHETLPRLCVYNASQSGATNHIELFKTSTRYYFGRNIKHICLAKPLVIPMVAIRQFLGKIFGRNPFERMWMLQYLDKQLAVDASRTFKELSWQPTPRYSIQRRLLFLVDNMKNNHDTWYLWNEMALKKVAQRPNLAIYDILIDCREELVEEIFDFVMWPEHKNRFSRYQKVDGKLLKSYIKLAYQLIATVVRTRDLPTIRNYAKIIAFRRFVEGFQFSEVKDIFMSSGDIISNALRSRAEHEITGQGIYDHVNMTVHLAVDQIEDYYEMLTAQSPEFISQAEKVATLIDSGEIDRIVRQLEDICQDMPDSRLKIVSGQIEKQIFR